MLKPSFMAAWTASQRIYTPSAAADRVAKVIGGAVATNIRHPTVPWTNTCAVRMSYILNQTGVLIPKSAGETVTGEDGRNYFYRVPDVISFLRRQWGPPETVSYPPAGGGALAGRKGVILFEVTGWSDALGHATLFDGNACYDHCYFNELEASYRTPKAHFWELP